MLGQQQQELHSTQKLAKHVHTSAAMYHCPVVVLAGSSMDAAGNTQQQRANGCAVVYAMPAATEVATPDSRQSIHIPVQLYAAALWWR
jgi:hypothetical protein